MKIRKSMESVASMENKCPRSDLRIDPTEYADLLFGVGSATSAGPTLPAGSIHPSPETLERDCGGYCRNQPIVGFGNAYTSGAGGNKCYGNYLVAPMTERLTLNSAERASFAVTGTEIAKCFEYSVELENGIKARVAPARNSAIYSFEYPVGKDASFIIDVARKLDIEACLRNGSITVCPEKKTMWGGGLYSGNWSNIDWEMYFALEFDSDFEEIGYFKGEELYPVTEMREFTASIDSLERLGGYVKLGKNCERGKKLKVKISISFVSAEKAKEFLYAQIPGFDYGKVKDEARAEWRDVMSAIELKTDDADLLCRFYTAMYHMNIQPRDRTNDHGQWDDFHTVWDTWKTVFPMYSLLYPEKMGSLIDSFIDRARYNESVGNGIVISDEYVTAKEFLAGQGGNDIDNAIVDAYLKGIRLTKHEWEDAYKVLLRSAEKMRSPEYVERGFATKNAKTVSGKTYSWRFKPAAATMGFAFNDKAIAAIARELGTAEEYKRYEDRSANWLNVWNRELESEGFYGFPQNPREDGSFDPGFDAHGGYNTHFYEATGWDASYINYNDTARLVEAMGGAETFARRLLWACEHSVNYHNDDHGSEGYLNFTNEPSFQIPWIFCTEEVKRPDLAAKVIADIIPRFLAQHDYPGDEDNGGMSSYFIFLMCGFFPFSTTEYYYLHGTRVEEIVFRLGNGRNFKITGENVGGDNIYVQSATLRGEPLDRCRITHAELLQGGELHFVMGDKPSDWARK
ncbi:MAG: GH92 family glycosyl hydrolase [Clostridia bacterium]|nr:GH92 family glycosyl hydrolase [Clostridia bacterium]